MLQRVIVRAFSRGAMEPAPNYQLRREIRRDRGSWPTATCPRTQKKLLRTRRRRPIWESGAGRSRIACMPAQANNRKGRFDSVCLTLQNIKTTLDFVISQSQRAKKQG